jgi:O-antigen/teichoic acid export membrane protein
MTNNIYLRAANIVIQGSTLASRFLLVFLLARYLEPAQLGLYGLLTVTVGYSLYLLGFDFYVFTTRELIRHEKIYWGKLLKDQAVLSLIFYMVFLPLLLLVFSGGFLPWKLAPWFFALLVLEHLNQELGRLLVALSQPLWASVVLFLRQGSWAIVITILMAMQPQLRSVEMVFAAWSVGAVCALIIGISRVASLRIGGWRTAVDWKWIRAGLKVSLPFFLATLCIRGLFTADRYWLNALAGLDVVGAYVLFAGVASTLMTFLDAGVFSFAYPGLIRAHHEKHPELFKKYFSQLFWSTCVLSIGFAIVSMVLLPLLLVWMGKPFYLAHQSLYPWLLGATILYALGMVPHYGLYAQGFDRPIIYSHAASLAVFVGATWIAAQFNSLIAVPLGLCATFAIIAMWKGWAFFALTPVSLYSFQFRHKKVQPGIEI